MPESHKTVAEDPVLQHIDLMKCPSTVERGSELGHWSLIKISWLKHALARGPESLQFVYFLVGLQGCVILGGNGAQGTT